MRRSIHFPQTTASKGLPILAPVAKLWRTSCLCRGVPASSRQREENSMINFDEIKITRRDAEVLHLLVQGCSNKEIAGELNISPRTVKQHLRTLFLRAGIRDGRKRVKLATAMFQRQEMEACNHR